MPDGGTVGDPQGMSNHTHDTPQAVRELHELRYEGDVGRSDRTPLILLGEVWIFCAVLVLIVLAAALIGYRLAS
jgi:hypothetical protein